MINDYIYIINKMYTLTEASKKWHLSHVLDNCEKPSDKEWDRVEELVEIMVNAIDEISSINKRIIEEVTIPLELIKPDKRYTYNFVKKKNRKGWPSEEWA